MKKILPVFALSLASACTTAPKPVATVPCKTLYVYWPKSYGDHTSLLINSRDFPVAGVFEPDPPSDPRRVLIGDTNTNPNLKTDWVEVGFSEADYVKTGYMPFWKMFTKTPAVVDVEPFSLGGDPGQWHGDLTRFWPIELPPDRYQALLDYVGRSFARNPDGSPILFIRIGADSFYRSTLPYSIGRFCHVWVLDALERAGVDTPGWALSQDQVIDWFRYMYSAPAACLSRS